MNFETCPICKNKVPLSQVCCSICGTPLIDFAFNDQCDDDIEQIKFDIQDNTKSENGERETKLQNAETKSSSETIELTKEAEKEIENNNNLPGKAAVEKAEQVEKEEINDNTYQQNDLNSNNFEDNYQEQIYERLIYKKNEKYENKGDDLFVNLTRSFLGILFALEFLLLLFPATSLFVFSKNLSIVDFAFSIPFFAGLIFIIADKKHIYKFIYATIVGLCSLLLFVLVFKPFPPSSLIQAIHLAILSAILLFSIVGNIAYKSSGLKKAQTWFNTFLYLIFFVNVLTTVICILAFNRVPADMFTPETKTYIIMTVCVCAFNVISVILMMKRKLFGADLLVISSICWIILNVVIYSKLMDFMGYRIDFDHMTVIGSIYSKLIALYVVYPIVMFVWVRVLKYKEES